MQKAEDACEIWEHECISSVKPKEKFHTHMSRAKNGSSITVARSTSVNELIAEGSELRSALLEIRTDLSLQGKKNRKFKVHLL